MRVFRAIAAAILLCSAGVAPAAPAFDRGAWLQDYGRLKDALAQGYANLDWQVDRRSFRPKRADEQIGAMLQKVGSDAEAAIVFAKLVAAFRDPHLELELGAPPPHARRLPAESAVDGSGATCRKPGAKPTVRLPYGKAAGWTPVGDGTFPAGTIGATGFIRIPTFFEGSYGEACAAAARAGMDDHALQLATRAELNRRVKLTVEALKSAGAKRLVVDLANNGGGSEWSSEVAAMLSDKPLRRTAPRLAAPACDRRGIWNGEPTCSIYGKPAEIETIEGSGLWGEPLVVLTDRWTASAAEELVTWLKDNDRATIVGEPTFGAGCGYVDGGNAFEFHAAALHLMIPNCSRYTREGINEIEGIAPQVAVDWGSATPAQALAAIESGFRP